MADPQAAGGFVLAGWLWMPVPERNWRPSRSWGRRMCGGVQPARGSGGTLGISSLSKSQMVEMAKDLDQIVTDFRGRPLDGGRHTYVWADSLTTKVPEGGRLVNVACLLTVGSTVTDTGRSSGGTSPPRGCGRLVHVSCRYPVFWSGSKSSSKSRRYITPELPPRRLS